MILDLIYFIAHLSVAVIAYLACIFHVMWKDEKVWIGHKTEKPDLRIFCGAWGCTIAAIALAIATVKP